MMGSARTGQERGGPKSEAVPGNKPPRAAKPSPEHRQAPKGADEPVPEEAPGEGGDGDGCPFFERRLELIV